MEKLSNEILIVIDQYENLSNGTTISAKRFAEGLRKAGNEVQVLSTGKVDGNDYALKTYKFPKIIDKYFKANEMVFAKPDEEVMRNVFKNQDIIHFYMPFRLARKGVKNCRRNENTAYNSISCPTRKYYICSRTWKKEIYK